MADAIITLIHGTFEPDAPWTLETSILRKTLTARLDGDVKFERYIWSGRNRITDRDIAADSLALFLEKQSLEHADRQQFVVAHSHGGSVLAYLLVRNQELASKIAGAAFLATPFIEARARPDWPIVGTITLLAFLVCFSMLLQGGLIFATVFLQEHGYQTLGRYTILPIQLLAMLAVPGIMAEINPRGIAKHYDVQQTANYLSTSTLPAGRYLFLKVTGDEAASALGTAQFVSWLMSRLISITSRPISAISKSKFLRFMIGILTIWGGFFSAFATIELLDGVSDPITFKLWIAEFINVSTFFWEESWWLGLIATTGVFLAFIFLVFAALWVICCTFSSVAHRVFGRLAFRTALFIDLSIESVPLGKHILFHAPWPKTHIQRLSHSSAYEDVEPVGILKDWVEAIMCERRSRERANCRTPE